MTTPSDDLSDVYTAHTADASVKNDAAEMRSWAQSFDADLGQSRPPLIDELPERQKPKARPLPEPKPPRTPSDDTLGRTEPQPKDESLAGKVARNVAEIPGQAFAGMNDAVENAFHLFDGITGGGLTGISDWLNDHVADLSFDVVPNARTGTGEVTRKVSEFLTGFITASKYLKAMGVTNPVVQNIGASMVADFVVRDPAEGRLADVWNNLGLPRNILTDYLASKPEDTEKEARFKNALESGGLGALTEGVFLGARMLRGLKSQPGVKQSEEEILKAKYGEFDEEYTKVIGDPTKPMIEISVKRPSDIGKKIVVPEPIDKSLIAPHQGKELKLMAKGDKPAAMVPDSAKARAAIEENGWVFEQRGKELFIGRDAESLRALKEADAMPAGDAKHRAFGRALGYTSDQIEEFIRSMKPQSAVADFEPRALIRSKKETGFVLPDDFEVAINFARIDEPNNIKFAMGKMAEALKSHIDEAKRGVITQKQTEQLADEMGMTVPDLLARRKGEAFNAEEALAARQLWAASAEKLVELAKRAAGPNAGDIDRYAFRKMMGVHAAIQNEVLGARAEAGRALAQWAIPAGGSIERARAVQQTLEAMGGPQEATKIAKRLAIMAEVGADSAAIARFAERGAGATTMDAIKEVWVNGLLSSPKTHVVNMASNSLVAISTLWERQAAEGIRAITGGEGVVPGEALAMAHGLIEGYGDAFRMAAKALKTGESGWSFNKIDLARPNAISADAFAISKQTGAGRFVDFLGKTVNIPGRLLTAEDEFFRTIGYRMNVRSEALRTATHEGLEGEQLAARYKQLVDNPSEAIRINAADAALYQTFTNETGSFGKAVMNFRNRVPASIFVLPFVRTPVNIARYAFERTPFAPLSRQWREDIAAGGARADLALARMSTGTAIMLVTMDMADRGMISGEGPREKDSDTREALLRQGWQQYSIRVGDKWYSYNRADPFGMTMGFAASIAEAVKKGEMDQDAIDEWQEVAAMSIAAVSQVTVSKTYLQGIAKFVEVMTDPKRYSQKYIDDLVASFIPAASLNNAVKNMVDPVQREVGTPWEAIQSRVAGLSQQLTPRRDLWGREIKYESGQGKAYDFLSPVTVTKEDSQPIDREIVRLGNGPERIQKRSVFDGVQANMRFYPEVYDQYTKLAGNDLKSPAHGGLGAMDYLNAIVSGKHPISQVYNIMSDESRKDFVMHTIRDYRRESQQAILQNPKYKDFAAEIARLKEIHQQSRMPVLGE